MFMHIALFCLAALTVVNGRCDNSCSGHGSCNAKTKCTCYDNWGVGLSHDTGDCSDRICPYEFAWVDTPDKSGSHHKYAECAAKGICNRDSGECECFPGYEGKACQRTSCPNDCSGHGQCTFIQNLPYAAVPFDNSKERYYLSQDAATYPYYYWDVSKTRGCVCDPEYADVDCSKRLCPYGTDVMDIRNNMLATGKYQVQQIDFVADGTSASPIYGNSLMGQTFALTFKSRLNETFTTIPIVFDNSAVGFHDFITDIQLALEGLPNGVIDKVVVQGSTAGWTTAIGAQGTQAAYVNISFVGDNVQGPQHLLTVKSIVCGDGCTPKLSGLELMPKQQNVTELQLSDFNSYECGRRGKCDYTSGLCNCFAGYTGANCNTITALV